MKKLCVTGGSGLLGCKLLQASQGSYEVLSLDVAEPGVFISSVINHAVCDITDAEALNRQLERFHPDVIIHTAAFTDVNGCEKDEQKAQNVNVQGTLNVARACQSMGAKLIHLSTDYVFDGSAGPYKETDEPNPINVYGRTKLESEQIVRNLVEDFVIARAMVLFGYVTGVRQNFVTWLIGELQRKKPIHIVDDQYGTPTLADDLALALLLLEKSGAKGLYHLAGSDCISRYEFALCIAQVFELDKNLILRTDSEMFLQPAKRPLKSGLVNQKIMQEYDFRFRSLMEGLNHMKHQMGREQES